ncbi:MULTISPECIES: DMT family transporter [Vibrio]|jgi:transporter family-2 protein|uniref:DMT family transporter n=3 Tax=Vibrio TaxID=662 RepID=A0A7X6S6T1_9VIBR|nr:MULTISPECIES: DMT family transporter [Vibrio]ASG01799.1 EamA-like transporter family protein [Vibrio anguillarum]ASG05474.1 EamA-like transporter family protein [Vibrio anguillarum]MBT2920652.1 DMT family transporter [Vibrio anguillarum]MBT2949752.1 DMT family transporter [Vibrio anguillarum]MDE1233374.1 DMT family transporter [Vibrio aestuarianus]
MEFILLGLLNGFCITLSRVLNGQLSVRNGAFHASFVNHAVGFVSLSLLFIFVTEPVNALPQDLTLYVGGVIGALYVAVNSFVMVRLGSTNSIVLVVAGQMLFGLFIEVYSFGFEQVGAQFLGAVLIVTGVFFKGRLGFQNK